MQTRHLEDFHPGETIELGSRSSTSIVRAPLKSSLIRVQVTGSERRSS